MGQTEQGFTILELMVVLGLVTIASVWGWFSLGHVLEHGGLLAAARALTSDIRSAQYMAQVQSREWSIRFDPADRSYTVGPEGAVPRPVAGSSVIWKPS